MKIHPAEELLQELTTLAETSLDRPLLQALLHVLRCPDCARRLGALFRPQPSLVVQSLARILEHRADYGPALTESVLESHRRQAEIQRERAAAGALLAELMARSPERWSLMLTAAAILLAPMDHQGVAALGDGDLFRFFVLP